MFDNIKKRKVLDEINGLVKIYENIVERHANEIKAREKHIYPDHRDSAMQSMANKWCFYGVEDYSDDYRTTAAIEEYNHSVRSYNEVQQFAWFLKRGLRL